MRLFDTHIHLDALRDQLGVSVGEVLARAAGAGVEGCLLVGVEPDNWEDCAEIAARHAGVRLALGIHPQAVRELGDEALEAGLASLPTLLRETGAVAVGEIGLDHLWDREEAQRARQAEVFRRQLDIAAAAALPVSVHCLRAHDPMLRLWREHPARGRLKGILHSYSGGAELVRVWAKEGLMFGFCGSLTWESARRLPAACRAVPDELLLIETDAPWQSPHPLDGSPNRAERLVEVAAAVASLRGVSVEAIAALTTANARRVLGLDA